MNRRHRAALFGALALLLGALAASDVSGREAALHRSLGRPVAVLVARTGLQPGAVIEAASLAIRRVPARYAPPVAFSAPSDVVGLKAAVAIPAGTDVLPALVQQDGPAAAGGSTGGGLRPGQRAASIVAAGSPDEIGAGSHVDVLVSTDDAGGRGATSLALQDAEVLAAAPADAGASRERPGPRVQLTLRVTLRQAVTLAAAQDFAQELRVLVRAPGDRHRIAGRLSVGA